MLASFGIVFALGLWAGRLRFTRLPRFEFRDDRYSWEALLGYINDCGFTGGFDRLSGQCGRFRSRYLWDSE